MFIKDLVGAHCSAEYGRCSRGTCHCQGVSSGLNAELPAEPSVHYYLGARSPLGPATSPVVILGWVGDVPLQAYWEPLQGPLQPRVGEVFR